MMDYTAIGDRIRAMRISKGLTQEKMAEQAGISVSFIGHIERGNRIASVETYYKIASCLGISIAYILEGDETAFNVKLWISDIIDILGQIENAI